jgi:hypothetical protein
VTIATHNSWKPGDARGWRARGHKRHSSGDYRSPPPEHEHEGLRRWMQTHSGGKVVIPRELRAAVVAALLKKIQAMAIRCHAISVSATHAHLVVELPDEVAMIRKFVGQWKQAASHAVRAGLPGKVWAEGGDWEPLDSVQRLGNAFAYVTQKQGPGAAVWSFREAGGRVPEGRN